jgi:hypothetical protein
VEKVCRVSICQSTHPQDSRTPTHAVYIGLPSARWPQSGRGFSSRGCAGGQQERPEESASVSPRITQLTRMTDCTQVYIGGVWWWVSHGWPQFDRRFRRGCAGGFEGLQSQHQSTHPRLHDHQLTHVYMRLLNDSVKDVWLRQRPGRSERSASAPVYTTHQCI